MHSCRFKEPTEDKFLMTPVLRILIAQQSAWRIETMANFIDILEFKAFRVKRKVLPCFRPAQGHDID